MPEAAWQRRSGSLLLFFPTACLHWNGPPPSTIPASLALILVAGRSPTCFGRELEADDLEVTARFFFDAEDVEFRSQTSSPDAERGDILYSWAVSHE